MEDCLNQPKTTWQHDNILQQQQQLLRKGFHTRIGFSLFIITRIFYILLSCIHTVFKTPLICAIHAYVYKRQALVPSSGRKSLRTRHGCRELLKHAKYYFLTPVCMWEVLFVQHLQFFPLNARDLSDCTQKWVFTKAEVCISHARSLPMFLLIHAYIWGKIVKEVKSPCKNK